MHFLSLQHEIEAYNKLDTKHDTNAIIIFLESLHHFMPCKKCRDEFCEYLATNNPRYFNGSLFEWTVDLHNYVNIKLNREVWDHNKARNFYMSFLI